VSGGTETPINSTLWLHVHPAACLLQPAPRNKAYKWHCGITTLHYL